MTKDTPESRFTVSQQYSRRRVLGGLGLLASAPLLARMAIAQSPPTAAVTPMQLPLKLTELIGHIGISVRDVIKSATFYSRLVGGANVNGEKNPSLRYFITLNPGSVAIGLLGTLGSTGKTSPLIDHFCVTAAPYDDAAWRARLKAEGLPYIAQGVFLGVDNIPIQVAGAQGGESLSVGAVGKLPSLYEGKPLIESRGYDHLMLRVRDIDQACAFWLKMFGFSATQEEGVAWISDGRARIGFRGLKSGEEPGIEHYALKTARFDRVKVSEQLGKMGASVGSFDARKKALNLADPDGIKLQLVSA